MRTISRKIILSLAGIIGALLVIEGVARLGGFIYAAGAQKTKPDLSAQTIRIACLGDSFTFGLGAGFAQDYPAQLEALLNKNPLGKKFVCFNLGVPGNNSSMLLKNLVRNINTRKPDLVIVLIGSNDSTTMEDNEYILSKGNSPGFFLKMDVLLSKSRVYKLMKISFLNLQSKLRPEQKINLQDAKESIPKQPAAPGEELSPEKENLLELAELTAGQRKYAQAQGVLERMPGGPDLLDRRQCLLLADIYAGQEKYNQAIKILEDYLKAKGPDYQVSLRLGQDYYYRGQLSITQKEADLRRAIDYLNQSNATADIYPYYRAQNYGYLARAYYALEDNQNAQKMIQEYLNLFPQDRFARQFKRMIRESAYSAKDREIYQRTTAYNLEKIINLCRLYNTRIILLNYPSETKDSLRKEVAAGMGVPFVDIAAVFAASGAVNPAQELFSSDRNHPNAYGYGLIAKALAQKLYQLGVFQWK